MTLALATPPMRDDNDPALEWPPARGDPGREVWYGLVGTRDGSAAVWYRYTLLSTTGGHQEGRLWAALTDRAGDHSTFVSEGYRFADVWPRTDPFRLRVGDAELASQSARGAIGGDDTPRVAWDLEYEPDTYTFTPLRSGLLTDALAALLGTGKHWSRNQSVAVSGSVSVGDHTVEFDDAPGHQGHTLGSSPPETWTWLHCNAFDGAEDVALEALNLGGTLSVCLRRDGDVHALNRVKHVVGPRANHTEHDAVGDWRFRAAGEGVELDASVQVPGTDLWQRVAYCAPDETRRYNAHCSLANVALTYRTHRGDTRTLESDAGRAEWVDTEPPVAGVYRPDWNAVLR